jgi:hypothetical protein
MCLEIPWRNRLPSLNILLSSHVWRQDHNGFTHQDPGFIGHLATKRPEIVRIYLPPDANCLLSVMHHCLKSRHYINVITAGKHPAPQWLTIDEARQHCTQGISIWEWASNDKGCEPDIIMACAGDVPTLEALAAVILAHPHLLVLSDEIYEKLIYDASIGHVSIASLSEAIKARTIVVNGVSKAYAMTGWRIGYAAGPVALIKAMGTIQSQSTSNPCSVSQYAALEALTGPQDFLATNRKVFERRRDLVVSMLNAAKGVTCPNPEGAFYVYPDISGCIGKATPSGTRITNDEVFATALLEETGVAVVFGAAFGLSPNFRVSYATADDTLREACSRIQRFCDSLT